MSDNESPEEIEREIEQTRADIDRTLMDLQHKLSPNVLIDRVYSSSGVKTALRSAGDGAAGAAAGLGRVMSDNPVPVLLTAVGIAWLAFAGGSSGRGGRRRRLTSEDSDRLPTSVQDEGGTRVTSREDPSRSPRYQYVNDPTVESGVKASPGTGGSTAGFGSGAGGSNGPFDARTDAEVTEALKAEAERRRGSSMGERARGAAASVSGRVERVTESVSKGVGRMTGVMKGSGGAYESTREIASRATHAVRQVPERVGGAYQSAGSFVQENPIISGALAVALGAALALFIPTTRRERKLAGEASGEIKASVREAVEETVDRAKEVVRDASDAATDAVRRAAKGGEAAVEQVGESVEGTNIGEGAPAGPTEEATPR